MVAPDKFKGSLTAPDAATAIERGLRSVLGQRLEAVLVPMADGGEGTVDAFLATGARRVCVKVHGPLGEERTAAFALDGSTAIIEMAAASGLELVPAGRRDPGRASTRGTGHLIRAALDAGARRIVIGIGGSATNDAGAGMLQALGVRLLDEAGEELEAGGAALARLSRLDLRRLDPRLGEVTLEVAADVDNPLCGPDGASAVFGPQKGASAADIATLDAALARFADIAAKQFGIDRRGEPGSGAAGGLGFGLRAFLSAELRPGVDLIAELRGLSSQLEGATLAITGEGSIDDQTLHGKTVAGVARFAAAAHVWCVAFGGRVDAAAETALGARGVVIVPIADGPLSVEESMARCGELLERAAARLARLITGARDS